MGPMRRKKGQNVESYDPELLENWTISRLKQELRNKGIHFSSNTRRMALVRLLRNHEQTGSTIFGPAGTQQSRTCANGSPREDGDLFGIARSHDSTGNTTPTDIFGIARSRDALDTNNTMSNEISEGARSQNSQNVNNNGGDHTNRVLIDLVSKLSNTVQSLQQNVVTLTGQVKSIISERSSSGSNSREENTTTSERNRNENTDHLTEPTATGTNFNLESGYRALTGARSLPPAAAGSEQQMVNSLRSTRGYSAESLPVVETISPQLRKNIIAGMDINLAALLIPYYSGTGIHESNFCEDKSHKPDPRTSRSLSLGEFIQAFGIYKNIMCSAFPNRRSELDLYERDIVDMASRYPGGGFYEYHRKFSADAAAHLRFNNVVVDWSIRNNTLFCNIFANVRPNSCNTCGSTFHTTGFCAQSVSNNQSGRYFVSQKYDQDSYGREKVFHMGREICNNFNGFRGCVSQKCRNYHVCIICKGDHSKQSCTQAKNERSAPQKIGAITQRKN